MTEPKDVPPETAISEVQVTPLPDSVEGVTDGDEPAQGVEQEPHKSPTERIKARLRNYVSLHTELVGGVIDLLRLLSRHETADWIQFGRKEDAHADGSDGRRCRLCDAHCEADRKHRCWAKEG